MPLPLRPHLVLGALAAGVVVAPSIGLAAPAAVTAPAFHTIDVEVVDVGADKKTATTRFTVTAAEGWSTGKLEAVVAPFTYDVFVHCDPAQGTKLPISIDLKRRDSRPGSPGDVSLAAGAIAPPSTRVQIASIARPDGGTTEIAIKAQ